jgi:hypothetical protein
MKTLLITSVLLISSIGISIGQSFDWATASGGTGCDRAYAIATDNDGNSYVTGWFLGSAHFGDIVLNSEGEKDVFLAKYNYEGEVIWAKKYWGVANNTAAGICLDWDSFPIITGWFAENIHFDDIVLESHGSYDMFVARINANGEVIWAKSAGGEGDDYGNRVTTNLEFDVLVSGSFKYTSHFGETTITSEGNRDIFIANYSNAGNFQWVKKAGGAGEDRAYDIVSGPDGQTYFTGMYNGKAFFGDHDIMSGGIVSTFIAKMNAGGEFMWVRNGTGGANDYARGYGISLDNEGNVIGNGTFSGLLTFSESGVQASGGFFDFDTYIVKYDNEGNLSWLLTGGGYGDDQARDIFTDSNGSSYSTGYFSGTAQFGDYQLESAGMSDVFVIKYSWAGEVMWAKRAGGPFIDYAFGVSKGNSEQSNLFLCGTFQEEAAFDDHAVEGWGLMDMFTAKLNYDNDFVNENGSTKVNITPNPSDGTFDIFPVKERKQITINIYNSAGELILEKAIAVNNEKLTLKTDLSSGSYLISIPELNISEQLIIIK